MIPVVVSVLVGICTGFLPAYSHNDYERDRPLTMALELGLAGVEVDLFWIDGELRVGHDRSDTRPGRTLTALYLDPLREWAANRSAAAPLTLNLELKQGTREAYDALRAELLEYTDLLTVVEGGEVRPGPVQAVMVGGHPPLADLAREEVRVVGAHLHFHELPANHAEIPSHLLRMVSVNYRRSFTWTGFGRRPNRFFPVLEQIEVAAHRVPGRILRVYWVPRSAKVYRSLLSRGVDLIGTKHPAQTHKLLTR